MNRFELADFIRKSVVKMTSKGNSSHVGSCLSIADILAVIYTEYLDISPKKFKNIKRDRFVLSKGHAGAAIYSTLAGMGFIDKKILETHYQNGSILSGHVSHKSVPGVELSTGSLGHGLSVCCGFAHGMKLDNVKNKVVCLLSDGECDEGSIWESVLYANHFNLDNLTVIIDYNKIQSLDSVENTIKLEPFSSKWSSFGWTVFECDGHNHDEIKSALYEKTNHPKVIIAHTTKGNGVSFMENNVLWHYRSPQGEELSSALKELNNEK